MPKKVSSSALIVWAALIMAALVSWILGGVVKTGLFSSDAIAILVLAVSFFKTRLILIHFMELGDAPWKLRLVFEVWVLLSCVLLVAAYFIPIADSLPWL